MKIIRQYASRIQAELAQKHLMQKGVATVLRDDSAVHGATGLICLIIRDEDLQQAEKALTPYEADRAKPVVAEAVDKTLKPAPVPKPARMQQTFSIGADMVPFRLYRNRRFAEVAQQTLMSRGVPSVLHDDAALEHPELPEDIRIISLIVMQTNLEKAAKALAKSPLPVQGFLPAGAEQSLPLPDSQKQQPVEMPADEPPAPDGFLPDTEDTK